MSQLSILVERLEGRPREEWFSDLFYMDWEEQHTSKRKCVTREEVVVEKKKKDKITELFLFALHRPACTAAPVCGNIIVHVTTAKLENATSVQDRFLQRSIQNY